MSSIISEGVLSRIDHRELHTLIFEDFSLAKQIENKMVFLNEYRVPSVIIKYSKRAKTVVSVIPEKAMPSDYPSILQSKIDRYILADNGFKIGRTIMFCDYPVKGYFKVDEMFQILPVPEGAPQAEQFCARHPFILEFRFKPSTHPLINIERVKNTVNELSLVLNILLEGAIAPQSKNINSHWV